jgi:hypothetical protein
MEINKSEILEEMKMMINGKEEVLKAIDNLKKFFQNYNGEYFGLDDLGIIDLYVRHLSTPIN